MKYIEYLKSKNILIEKVNGFSYSCVMLEISYDIHNKIKNWCSRFIDDKNLYINEKEGIEGYPNYHHVIIKYGIHTNNLQEIYNVIGNIPRFKINLEYVTKFENKDCDVLKVDVTPNDELWTLRRNAENLEYTDTHKEYKPHITLAYLKKGTQNDLVFSEDFYGLIDFPTHLRISTANGDVAIKNLENNFDNKLQCYINSDFPPQIQFSKNPYSSRNPFINSE